MSYPDATETLEHILKPTAYRLRRQETINQKTELRYEALSALERKNLTEWLQHNLPDIPIPSKIKTSAMEKLLLGDYHCPATLVLIRHTLSALSLRAK